jgi:stage V sporulation protein AC
MNKLSYKNIVDKVESKGKIKRAALAFLGGAIIAGIGQGIYDLYFMVFSLDSDNALSLMLVTIIFFSALLTGFGIFDKIAQIFGAGTFVPISGFSNSLTSAALESKAEGLIYGIGSNMFKLAGSVITYGIVSAYLFGIIRYFIMLVGGVL